jgi:hypothetical protein
MNSESSGLQYLDASDIHDERLDFDDLDVLDTAGQKLGDVEGFIVRRATGRPYYVVVDSGGWFTSRSFLVPIGHVRLDSGNEALRSDLDRGVIERFPEFEKSRFEQMTENEARLFNERTLGACCAGELGARTGADRDDYETWSHYAQPDWWRSTWFTAAPPGISTRETGRAGVGYVAPSPAAVPPRDEVLARERDFPPDDAGVERTRSVRHDERLGDVVGRAQPGDVLGIENAGEITNLGDTAHDERKRLDDAEEDAADLRRNELKDKNKDKR